MYNLYTLPLGTPRHYCLPNMGAQLPTDRIWQPKPCCQKRTPILGVPFWQLGLGYQIRSVGNYAPIFGGRTDFMHTKHTQTYLLVLQLKKIDTSPFLVVPDSMSNLT